MFSHVMVGVNDMNASKAFYDALLGTIGVAPGFADPKGRVFTWRRPACSGSASQSTASLPVPPMAARSALPRPRPNRPTPGMPPASPTAAPPARTRRVRRGNLYLAYLRDPAGNKLCALHQLAG